MRVASIICENFTHARSQITQALAYADVIELRLDYLPNLDIAAVQQLRHEIVFPVIFTLRKRSQGGACDLPETQRLQVIEQLAALSPDYLDLEFDTKKEFIISLRQAFPTTQLICSYHDFEQTPPDLETLFQTIYCPLFTIFKIATFANTLCDSLRLLLFTQKISQQHQVITIAMGEYGQVSRIVATIMGSLMTFGSVDEQSGTAPGQLTLRTMTEVYRVQSMNKHTAIYALLGYPVAQSPGHLFHNWAFSQLQKNAVYVKLLIAPESMAQALPLLRQLPFAGFSITIPHKETAVEFTSTLCGEAQFIHTVNTLKRQQKEYHGYNTDGSASIEVLTQKTSLKDKQVLILGAGGSAKAIAHALIKQQAYVTLCNRTLQRAALFAQHHGGTAIDFPTLFADQALNYTIIINTLPAAAFAAQCAHWTIPPTKGAPKIAMDIVLKPLETTFLQMAQAAGYQCVAGDALFISQALQQLRIWFDSDFNVNF